MQQYANSSQQACLDAYNQFMAITSRKMMEAILVGNGLPCQALLVISGRSGANLTLTPWSKTAALQLEVDAALLHLLAQQGELDCYCDDDTIEGALLITACASFAAQYFRLRVQARC